ncbi:hypothetical protein [Dyella amyloliquefaciens]|uniref:hypothetical protein n=1 Tax=Dyella amyloliquefaciens TaxID=1770545 RepID=UPI00102ED481|nr:hypothetical protein [Dyella amyloliquefaciens]
MRQLVTVGFRLFAIWLCITAFQAFGLIASVRKVTSSWGDSPWLGMWIVGIFIGVAIIVWAISTPLSRMLTYGMSRVEDARVSATDLVAVGCVLMGLWWLKEATFPLLGLWLKAVALSPEAGQTAFALLGAEGKVAAGLDLLEIGVGSYFVMRPYKIARRLISSVTAATDPESPS